MQKKKQYVSSSKYILKLSANELLLKVVERNDICVRSTKYALCLPTLLGSISGSSNPPITLLWLRSHQLEHVKQADERQKAVIVGPETAYKIYNSNFKAHAVKQCCGN